MDRPVRSTRGVRTTPLTQQQQKNENALYDQYFGNAVEVELSDESLQPGDMFQAMTKVQKAQFNCMLYPFSRAIHYYHNVSQYPRLDNTSYVQDIHPFGTYHDDKLIDKYGSQNLINRTYLGLPIRLPGSVNHDKNQCHEYLFKNQDRKWKLDQQLYQLKYIDKHPQILKTDKVKNFYYLKRDIQLTPLYDPNISYQDKLTLLKSKIQFLQSRKNKLFEQLWTEDQFFYPISRDQLFFNKKQEQESAFDIQNIIVEAICSSVLSYDQSAQQLILRKQIQSRFSIFSTIFKQGEVQHPMYKKECQDYLKRDNHQVYYLPSFMFDFSNKHKLDWVGQVIGVRVMEKDGIESFNTLKDVWKKLFGLNMQLNDEFLVVQRWQYVQAIRSLSEINHKHTQIITSLPQLPNPIEKNIFYFQQSEHLESLTIKQYLILYLVYYLYERSDFTQLDYRLVGSPLFDKYQFVLLEKLGKQVINFEMSLKKLAEVIAQNIQDSQVPIFIKYQQFNAQNLIIVWIEGKDIGEQELEEQLGEEELQGQQDGEEDEEDDGEQEENDEDEDDNSEDEQSEQPKPPQGSIGEFPTKKKRFI